jgi:hypothetical protein
LLCRYGRIALRLLCPFGITCFLFGLFNLTNILGCPAGISTRYSSRLPFREGRASGALVKFFQCRFLGVCCGIPTFDEIRFLKLFMYPDLLHPSVGRLTSFPMEACAGRQPSLPQEYQYQCYAKRGYSTNTIDYVATNTAGRLISVAQTRGELCLGEFATPKRRRNRGRRARPQEHSG